jgi:amidase
MVRFMTDLTWMDATETAELIRSGQASAAEVVDAAIARVEVGNGAINAVIHPRYEKARSEAPKATGPFAGVPMVVKDLSLQTEGDPYHGGNVGLKNAGYTATADTALARKFKEAGFVIIGRTNTPEFGSTITTEPVAYGPSRNPWNTDYSTGGSSGGSAAAVAAGFVPVGHANDGGGSIRIPASECGLVGLKPSRGRVSQAPMQESWMGASIEGAVTRTVRDAAAVLDCISAPEPGDPYAAPHLSRSLLSEVGADPGRLRIGILDSAIGPDFTVHRECVTAVRNTADLLGSLGHHVETSHPAALTEAEFSTHFVNVVCAWTAHDLAAVEGLIGRPLTSEEVEPDNQFYRAIGEGLTGPQYLAAEVWLQLWSRRVAAWWADGFDLLVSPVIATPPPPIGYLAGAQGAMRVPELMQYTAQFNVTGQPAISLPLHWSADGLPVGVQFTSAYGREDMLIRIAAQMEDAQPWAAKRPG